LVVHQNPLEEISCSAVVGAAIAEHYLPQGAHSLLPSTELGVLLSLADKLDSLCLMINAGIDVKGNKDPLGLRRLAIGIARLIGLKGEKSALPFVLKQILDLTFDVFALSQIKLLPEGIEKTYQFILERIKHAWREEFSSHVVDATAAKASTLSLIHLREFTKALESALLPNDEASVLNSLLPYRRARNLTQHISYNYDICVQPNLFQHETETRLFECLQAAESKVTECFHSGNYYTLLRELALLGAPLEDFFNHVMVNDQNQTIKENRLALLYKVKKLYENVAEFSYIQA
ncbi:MAG: glycine--tRNA ligase subunit beta, partial [Silvanigrellaceae bacterium]|nr:glycine--tRNA ligase subunit beta [Silvanigrellaceae bacterium]